MYIPNEDDIDERNTGTAQNRSFIPGHTERPIVWDEADLLSTNTDWICVRHRKLKEIMINRGFNKCLDKVCINPHYCIHKYIKGIKTKQVSELFKNHLTVAIKNLGFHAAHVSKSDTMRQIYNYKDFIEIMPFYAEKLNSEKIKDATSHILLERGEIIEVIKDVLLMDPDISFFKCPKHGSGICPTSLVSNVLDMMQARFSTVMYTRCADVDKKYNTSLYDTFTTLINLFYSVKSKTGTHFWKLVKSIEPLPSIWKHHYEAR